MVMVPWFFFAPQEECAHKNPPPPWNTLILPASTKLLALRRDSMPMSPHSWTMGCGHSSNSLAFKMCFKKNDGRDLYWMHCFCWILLDFMGGVGRGWCLASVMFQCRSCFLDVSSLILLPISWKCPALSNLRWRSWKGTQNAEFS